MPQTREARREAQARKRAEAEARNAASNASRRACGHVHGDAQVWRCQDTTPANTPEQRLLKAIFGSEA